MKLIGRKTYIVCIAIIVLALCQWAFKLLVPQEVWFAVFGLLGIALKKSIGDKAALLIALLIPAMLFLGCNTQTTTNNVYVGCAIPTNGVAQVASRSVATSVGTNGVVSTTEVTTDASGGVVISNAQNLNSARQTDPQTTIPLSLAQ